jgi:L-tyrosine isonitrile synthase
MKETLASHILQIILQRSNPLPIHGDGKGTVERSLLHYQRILAQIKKGKTLRLVILGFPAKAANPLKTLSPLPDRGEVEGLKLLQEMSKEIGKIYSPGAKTMICSDGHVFSELVGVTDTHVDLYQSNIKEIIQEFSLGNLETFSMSSVMSGTYDGMRSELLRIFGEDISKVRERMAHDEEARLMFNGIHRFLFEDTLVQRPTLSRTQVRNETKDRAYHVIQHSNAFSRLVATEFPDAIRLSIHPQPVDSAKIGIKLVPGKDRWGTPWHNVLLEDASGIQLVRRSEAEKMGAELKLLSGKYAYFSMVAARAK